ncbi:MAG TPA: SUMF1/EgtB/PvdO family nonheme iron enzyme [Gemmataceae bacterium]|jgi:formylglycine-generating enzyme required for sulfatase activity
MRRLMPFSVAVGVCVLLTLWRPGDSPEAAPLRENKHKSYTETIPGSKVKFDMVAIRGGEFVMGSPVTEKGRKDDEGPPHRVKVQPFWMGKCEVTWDEYDLYWSVKPGGKKDKELESPKDVDAVTRPTVPFHDHTFHMGREGHPALGVSWHAAMQYCRWLSLKTGKVYRLPTEAEWECACRAGSKTAYFFGDDAAKLGDYAWFADNSDEKTYKVGSKKPNRWGLYDMYGNVSEWCLDEYKKDAYAMFSRHEPALRPVMLPDERIFPRVARGGSWGDEAKDCRSASRLASELAWIAQDPDRPRSIWWLTDADFVGFRIVRAVEEQDNLKGFRSTITRQSPVE